MSSARAENVTDHNGDDGMADSISGFALKLNQRNMSHLQFLLWLGKLTNKVLCLLSYLFLIHMP